MLSYGEFVELINMHAMKTSHSSPASGARERRARSLAIGLRGVITMLGCHCGKASHNASNARGATAGKMGRNSSIAKLDSKVPVRGIP